MAAQVLKFTGGIFVFERGEEGGGKSPIFATICGFWDGLFGIRICVLGVLFGVRGAGVRGQLLDVVGVPFFVFSCRC